MMVTFGRCKRLFDTKISFKKMLIQSIHHISNRLVKPLVQRIRGNVTDIVKKDFKSHYLPWLGVAIGISAFSFQIGVLFPWHEVLSVQFSSLEVNYT
jgi:hypothetical protein